MARSLAKSPGTGSRALLQHRYGGAALLGESLEVVEWQVSGPGVA